MPEMGTKTKCLFIINHSITTGHSMPLGTLPSFPSIQHLDFVWRVQEYLKERKENIQNEGSQGTRNLNPKSNHSPLKEKKGRGESWAGALRGRRVQEDVRSLLMRGENSLTA